MNMSVKSIVALAICIVAANILLVMLRLIVDLPWSDGLESSIATGLGALAWVLMGPRLKR